MIDREQIEADIKAAQIDLPEPGDLSPDEIAAAVHARVKGAVRCIGHAADLLGELDRVTAALGHIVFRPGIEAAREWACRGGLDPRVGVDYLAIGRDELERLERIEASNPEKQGRE
jgi:hypothetical protein